MIYMNIHSDAHTHTHTLTHAYTHTHIHMFLWTLFALYILEHSYLTLFFFLIPNVIVFHFVQSGTYGSNLSE